MSSPETEMAEAMCAYGMKPPNQIVFDGKIHRFGRKKSGWYVGFDGGVKAGAFGDWKLGITEKFIEPRQDITALDRRRIGQAMREAAVQREHEIKAKREQVARECTAIWEGARE